MSRPAGAWTRAAGLLLTCLTLIRSAAAQEVRPIPITELAAAGLSPSDLRLIAALRGYIPHVLRQNGTPGLNLAVARHRQIIWQAGFGYADLERKTPMTPRTVFHSGSMGKTYTATAVMQLVEQGVMSLDEPVNRYLKDFQIKDPLGDRDVTLRDLLTHRSGLTGNAAGSDYLPPKPLAQHVKETYGRTAFKEYSGAIPLWSAKVGEKYQYSNFGLATLGYLVEVTNPEHLSFSAYVQKHIIDPLGMTSTQYPPVQDAAHVRPETFARLSKGYARFGPVHLPTPAIYFADHPAGTVVSVPGEHIKLLLAYWNEGSYNGYQLLKPETVKLMLAPQAQVGGDTWVGLIWSLRRVGQPDQSWGHGGAHMWGWTNQFHVYPGQDVAVAISMNQWPIPDDATERYREANVIADFITGWIRREQAAAGAIPPEHTWAWKTSYVIGLQIAEKLAGTLGIDKKLVEESGEAMARGARQDLAPGVREPVWDPAGFRAGLTDMLAVPMVPDSVRAFMRSTRLQVAPEELALLFRELGGRGGLPALP